MLDRCSPKALLAIQVSVAAAIAFTVTCLVVGDNGSSEPDKLQSSRQPSAGKNSGHYSALTVVDDVLQYIRNIHPADLARIESGMPLVQALASHCAHAGALNTHFRPLLDALLRQVADNPMLREAVVSVWTSAWLNERPFTEEQLSQILTHLRVEEAAMIVVSFLTCERDGLAMDARRGVAILTRAGFAETASFAALAERLVEARGAQGYKAEDIEAFVGSCPEGVRSRIDAAQNAALTEPGATGLVPFLLGIPENTAAEWCMSKRIGGARLKEVLIKMDEGRKATFLQAYARKAILERPDAIQNVLDAVRVGDLAGDLRSFVAGAALCTDVGSFQRWIEGLPNAEKASLLDTAYTSAFDPSGPFYHVKPDKTFIHSFLEARIKIPPIDSKIVTSCLARLPTLELAESMHVVSLLPQADQEAAKHAFYEAKVSGLLSDNPSRLSQFIEGLTPDAQGKIGPTAFAMLYGVDPAGALSWWSRIQNPQLKLSMARALFVGSADYLNVPRSEKERILGPILDSGADATAIAPLVTEVFSDLGRFSTADGKRLLSKVPDGRLKLEATRTFARQWSEQDPAAASEWMATLPAGEYRDNAVRELVACSRDDPERALMNAHAIQDPALRAAAAKDVIDLWTNIDPASALSFARAAGFTEADLAELRGQAEKR